MGCSSHLSHCLKGFKWVTLHGLRNCSYTPHRTSHVVTPWNPCADHVLISESYPPFSHNGRLFPTIKEGTLIAAISVCSDWPKSEGALALQFSCAPYGNIHRNPARENAAPVAESLNYSYFEKRPLLTTVAHSRIAEPIHTSSYPGQNLTSVMTGSLTETRARMICMPKSQFSIFEKRQLLQELFDMVYSFCPSANLPPCYIKSSPSHSRHPSQPAQRNSLYLPRATP